MFQNGDVDFRFTPDELDIGATTGFEYTVTYVNGDRDTTIVDVRWEEVAPNCDLFAATVTMGNERIAKQDDGTALLWGQKTLDDAPITITAINGDPNLVASA